MTPRALVLALSLGLSGCATLGGGGGGSGHPGYALYRARCTSCHSEVDRAEHTPDQWVRLVARYGKRLSDEDRRVILAYLSGQPAAPAQDPALAARTPGG